MPAVFQDMFGWEEMVARVADAYHALPHEDRAVAAVNANNYGQAAAIDFFGEDHGLPKAISTHNAYWYWGPRDYTGDVMLTVGVRPQALQSAFGHCHRTGGRSITPACMHSALESVPM